VTAQRRSSARRWIRALALLSALLGLGNLLKAARAARYAPSLAGVPMAVPWAYLIGGGLVWGAAFVVTSVGLWRLGRWGCRLMLIATTGYVVHVWVDRGLWAPNAYARQTQARDFVLATLLLAFVWAVLSRPAVRDTCKVRRPEKGQGLDRD
jgi:hypothetical protein